MRWMLYNAYSTCVCVFFFYRFVVFSSVSLFRLSDVGALPGKSTGLHRFVFLVFEQPKGKIDFPDAVITERDATRTKFSVREFMAQYHFNQPIAINFFQAKYDASVVASTKRFLNLSDDNN